jgi:hypothetical protein
MAQPDKAHEHFVWDVYALNNDLWRIILRLFYLDEAGDAVRFPLLVTLEWLPAVLAEYSHCGCSTKSPSSLRLRQMAAERSR